MGTMSIPDHTGHRAVSWRADDPASVAAVEREFRALVDQRLVPFRRLATLQKGSDYEQIRTFDPTAEEIMWVRPLQGG